MYYYGPMNGGYDTFGIFMMAFWGILLIFAIIVVYRILKGRGITTAGRPNPLDIAKERYAKGEIDKEQFEQLKKDLS